MPLAILESDQVRATLFPEVGASIISFEGRFNGEWQLLMRPTSSEALHEHDVSQFASFNLVPWSNRIVGAAFPFQGQTYHLRANTPQGFAIHGDARERPWRVVEQTADT